MLLQFKPSYFSIGNLTCRASVECSLIGGDDTVSALSIPNAIAFPKMPCLELSFKINCGGNLMVGNSLIKKLQSCIDYQTWNSFSYKATNDDSSDKSCSFKVLLNCQIFNKETRNELDLLMSSNDYKVMEVEKVQIELDLYHHDGLINDYDSMPTEQFETVLEILNYLICGTFLRLDTKFPFVFSFFGRQSFRDNYQSAILLSNLFSDSRKPHSRVIKKLENHASQLKCTLAMLKKRTSKRSQAANPNFKAFDIENSTLDFCDITVDDVKSESLPDHTEWYKT